MAGVETKAKVKAKAETETDPVLVRIKIGIGIFGIKTVEEKTEDKEENAETGKKKFPTVKVGTLKTNPMILAETTLQIFQEKNKNSFNSPFLENNSRQTEAKFWIERWIPPRNPIDPDFRFC